MKIEIVEMFPGGGTLLEALIEGLREAGAVVEVVGLIELEARYLARASKAHPESSTWHGSSGEYHPAEISAAYTADDVFRIFVAGIPCTGASKAGLSKNGLSCAEEHPDVGYLFLTALHYIRLHRPHVFVGENTDAYIHTLSAKLIRDALTQSGYQIDERIVNPLKEFESPTQRKRWVMVASRLGRFSWLYEAKAFKGTLAEFLDPESPEDDIDSASPEQVEADAKYCSRKASEGCGFAMTLIDRNSTKCPTIPKSYGKRQPTGTFVRTAKSYRMIRPREVARIHGFKRELFADLPKTTQYELYGQGVEARTFMAVGHALVTHLRGDKAATPVGQLELFAG